MGSNTGTVMTLANSIIGVSVLAMPFCFKQCGVLLSIVMLIMSSMVSRMACYFLLKAAHMARRRNFEFLAFHTFGQTGKFIVELCIIGFLMGTCIAFFVVVGDLGPVIIAKTFGLENSPALRPSVLIGLAAFVVLPLGLLKNVDSLSSICTATIGFYLCLVLKVVSEATPHLQTGEWLDKVNYWRPAGILQCIPIFSMALFCQTQLFEIYESLPNASLEKMNNVVQQAVNMCTAVYICVGFFGYVAFCTQNFAGNILMSFTPTLTSDVIKLGFVLSVAVSFPLVIFPCRASLYSLLFRRAQVPHHEAVSSHIPEARFKCITFFIISVSLVIGLLIPNIELVLGLVGSTIGVIISIMFPAVAFIRVSSKNTHHRNLAQGIFFIGILIMILGTYANLYATQIQPDMPDSAVTKPSILILNHPEMNEKIMESPVEMENENKKQELVEVKKDTSEKKADVRQEPPVPVEPDAVVVATVPPVAKELDEPSKKLLEPVESVVEEAVASVNRANTEEEVKLKGKDKLNGEQVNQDAIKKEDEELAEAEVQAKGEAEKKNEELLRKLEKHKEEQKMLLQEQKQILEELKEHKKEIDREKQGDKLKTKAEKIIKTVGTNDGNQTINVQDNGALLNTLKSGQTGGVNLENDFPKENLLPNAQNNGHIGNGVHQLKIVVHSEQMPGRVQKEDVNKKSDILTGINNVPVPIQQPTSYHSGVSKENGASIKHAVPLGGDAGGLETAKMGPGGAGNNQHQPQQFLGQLVSISEPKQPSAVYPLPLAMLNSSRFNSLIAQSITEPKVDETYEANNVAINKRDILLKSESAVSTDSKRDMKNGQVADRALNSNVNSPKPKHLNTGINNDTKLMRRDILSNIRIAVKEGEIPEHEREKRDTDVEINNQRKSEVQPAETDIMPREIPETRITESELSLPEDNCDAKDNTEKLHVKLGNTVSAVSPDIIKNNQNSSSDNSNNESGNKRVMSPTDHASINSVKKDSELGNGGEYNSSLDISEKQDNPTVTDNLNTQNQSNEDNTVKLAPLNIKVNESPAAENLKTEASNTSHNGIKTDKQISPEVTNNGEDRKNAASVIRLSAHLSYPEFNDNAVVSLPVEERREGDMVVKPLQRDLKSVHTQSGDEDSNKKK